MMSSSLIVVNRSDVTCHNEAIHYASLFNRLAEIEATAPFRGPLIVAPDTCPLPYK